MHIAKPYLEHSWNHFYEMMIIRYFHSLVYLKWLLDLLEIKSCRITKNILQILRPFNNKLDLDLNRHFKCQFSSYTIDDSLVQDLA